MEGWTDVAQILTVLAGMCAMAVIVSVFIAKIINKYFND